jgi:guanidinoacetate N-methyltransferase
MPNYLSLAIRTILSKTGWTNNELGVFSALLEKGAMSLTEISNASSVGTSSVQDALKKLSMKKMVTKTLVNDRPVYNVTNIRNLVGWVKSFTKQYKAYESTIHDFVEAYDFSPNLTTPKIRIYEGHKGVMQSYRQMLSECREKEILAIFSVVEDVGEELQTFFDEEYVPQRVEKKIKMRNITIEGATSTLYKLKDAEALRETKIVDGELFPSLNTEINFYDDSMHCMSFDESGAFAIIIKDEKMTQVLKSFFNLIWFNREWEKETSSLYMTDDTSQIESTIKSRQKLYPKDLENKWRNLVPKYEKTPEGEDLLIIEGHEVMASYETEYMHKLADIVTKNGGDIINVGYGLGIIDKEIETYRKKRKLGKHYVIELNKYIAEKARQNENLIVLEGCWKQVIQEFKGDQFDGIIYDAYPLKFDEVNRDGINFIEAVVERNLLKKDGILTFYADAAEKFGDKFLQFLRELGFSHIDTIKVAINIPDRERQGWRADHFLAPILKYQK